MNPAPNFTLTMAEPTTGGRDEESLFARDDNDVLIRREKETRERFREFVTITIDGYEVKVPRAVAKTDSQGAPLRDADGERIPRTTTIYDAAVQLVANKVWSDEDLAERIPVLCHQQHVTPVAVCRMCSVHISSIKRGKLTPGRKLVPACQHRVETDMVVTTRGGGDGYNPETQAATDMRAVAGFAKDVHGSVKLIAEFLTADHCHPDITTAKRLDNELTIVAGKLGITPESVRPRLARAPQLLSRNAGEGEKSRRLFALPLADDAGPEPVRFSAERLLNDVEWNEDVEAVYPYSSPTVVVDHDKCIVCDRCVRACSEVRPFKVIGHTGKGYGTRISFDLDQVMSESSCVQCGECMNSCPTGALSLRRRVKPRAWPDSSTAIPENPNVPFKAESGFLTADEIQKLWLWYDSPRSGKRVVYPFKFVPYSYLKWNEGAVRKWVLKPGERKELCVQGVYDNTAFLLQGSGSFEIYVRNEDDAAAKPGFFGKLFGGSRAAKTEYGPLRRIASGDELVIGEMACLTQQARTASVVAVADPANKQGKRNNPTLTIGVDENDWPTVAEDYTKPGPVVVYEITRNLLDMMQRSESARIDVLEMYTDRAIRASLERGTLVDAIEKKDRDEARKFLIDNGARLRRVEKGATIVAENEPASDFYIIRLGTVRVFQTVAGREQVLRLLTAGECFGEAALLADTAGNRSASIAALDPVEVVWVPGPVFIELCAKFPGVRERLLSVARPAVAKLKNKPSPGELGEYVQQGLFQGQRLLVLDLTSCTRCDECTRACADSHGDGVARLLREGQRFGDFLVATSCRSCLKPYCMEGCPVDAIHRKGTHLEVIIENHCIGCGLCEKNCPYGAIHMVDKVTPNLAAANHPTGDPTKTAARKAANCDQCGGAEIGNIQEPYCVKACPHVAAHRMYGHELLDEVLDRLNKHS